MADSSARQLHKLRHLVTTQPYYFTHNNNNNNTKGLPSGIQLAHDLVHASTVTVTLFYLGYSCMASILPPSTLLTLDAKAKDRASITFVFAQTRRRDFSLVIWPVKIRLLDAEHHLLGAQGCLTPPEEARVWGARWRPAARPFGFLPEGAPVPTILADCRPAAFTRNAKGVDSRSPGPPPRQIAPHP